MAMGKVVSFSNFNPIAVSDLYLLNIHRPSCAYVCILAGSLCLHVNSLPHILTIHPLNFSLRVFCLLYIVFKKLCTLPPPSLSPSIPPSLAPFLPCSLPPSLQLFALILLLLGLILAAVGTGLTQWARFETEREFPDEGRSTVSNGRTYKTQV